MEVLHGAAIEEIYQLFDSEEVTEIPVTKSIFWPSDPMKIVLSWSSALDPTGVAYDASQTQSDGKGIPLLIPTPLCAFSTFSTSTSIMVPADLNF